MVKYINCKWKKGEGIRAEKREKTKIAQKL